MTVSRSRGSLGLASLVLAVCFWATGASAARADACDDLAKQLQEQIDGLTVGAAALNQVELKHPAVKRAALGCPSRNITNEVFAVTDARKPAPAFYDFVAKAAAMVFTIPVDDIRNGTTRCVNRIGFLRGANIVTRYRRLDIRCSGSKTGTVVSISREKDS
jgi:hypothetical protein